MLCLADWLTITGGVCEASGIALTVRELVRVEDRAFPERQQRLVRAWRRASAAIRRRPPPQVAFGSGSMTASGGGSATLTVGRAPAHDPDDLKARIERLEAVVDDRARESREAIDAANRRIGDVERSFGERVDGIVREQRERDAQERAALADSLTLQKFGAALFIFGAALSTIGGVLS